MILTLDFNRKLSPTFWDDRRPLILACGCFDLLTIGHIRHLQAAKRLGKTLCVLVTADCYVGKGPGRPLFEEDFRVEAVDALECVDFTILNRCPTAVEAVRCLRPDVYAKGREYRDRLTSSFQEELTALSSVGGKIAYTETEELHTTDVVNLILETVT